MMVAVVGLLLAVVQVGIYFHGRSVALTAARHGVDTARVLGGTGEAGAEMTTQFLTQHGEALVGSAVTATRDIEEASVTVTGSALSVLPGVSLPVTVTVRAPVERVIE